MLRLDGVEWRRIHLELLPRPEDDNESEQQEEGLLEFFHSFFLLISGRHTLDAQLTP